jgi:hypothetical protein
VAAPAADVSEGITCLCGGLDGKHELGCGTLDAKQAGKAMTVRCAFCPWTLNGTTRECIAAGVRHRRDVHGVGDPKKKPGDAAKAKKARAQRERTEQAAGLLPHVRRVLQDESEVTEHKLKKDVPSLTTAMITMLADHGAIETVIPMGSTTRRISLPAQNGSATPSSPS